MARAAMLRFPHPPRGRLSSTPLLCHPNQSTFALCKRVGGIGSPSELFLECFVSFCPSYKSRRAFLFLFI